MKNHIHTIIYVAVMILVILGVDIFVFRHKFWERLFANIGIVMMFLAFYWLLFKLK